VKTRQSAAKGRLRCDGRHTVCRQDGNNPGVIANAVKTLAQRYDPSVSEPPLEARIRLVAGDEAHDAVVSSHGAFIVAANGSAPDAVIEGGAEAWRRAADDGGLASLRRGGLHMRRNLHVAVGFLAGTTDGGGLRLRTYDTPHGAISAAEAGTGPALLAVHGLGGSKASFLPTIGALADRFRVIAVDLPGFGDSVKPLRAPFDAPYFAGVMVDVLDAAGVARAHVVGNSMGGRIGIEMALTAPERVDRLVLLSPAMAWLRARRWAPLVRLLRPELSLVPMPVEPIVRRLFPAEGWAAAGMDEFLRSYRTPRGRHAFNAAARNIYLDEPHGEDGMWSRLRELQHESLFIWGRKDTLVPIAFMKHVERTLPAARHVELDCGHVPQVERPRETHAAIRDFLGV
jgi:pimeloyl-ACP methyl ester carboxylesterase